jgi:class 3 adenylate cyclase
MDWRRWSLGRRSAAPSSGAKARGGKPLAGPFGGRLSFSLALVGLAVGLTVLTGAVLGALAWQEKRAFSREIVNGAMTRTGRLAAAQVERFLRDAESAVRLGPEMVAQALLDPASDEALERFALATLRAHPHLAWVSYGGRNDHFVGAWRDAAGDVYVNRSWPVGARIHLLEERISAGGARETVRRSDNHGYRPHERPYFQLAERRRAVTWTEPYEFYSGGGLGMSCVAPLVDASGGVRGVFTVDISLDGLAEFLDGLRVSPRGRVFAATAGGEFVIGPRRVLEGDDAEGTLIGRMIGQAGSGREASFAVMHDGERVLGRSVPVTVGETPWRVVVSVPERDYTDPVDALARRTVGLGLLGLALVATGGVIATRRLTWPIRRLAAHAMRVARRRRDAVGSAELPDSRDEIRALAHSLQRAARTARDRHLVSGLLSRYVNPELAQRWLQERRSPRLGGEPREVAILMSDLRGFSALSEELGPEAVFGVLNRYLGRMTDVIHAHGGAINEFIGDGILVLFGAPTARPDDAARAVRCAWAMQEALAELNTTRSEGDPELQMGIGLNAGTVVAGHIGGRNRAAYTVVGPVVNRTSRMVDLAEAGEVLLSDVMLVRVRDQVDVGPARRANVKGVSAPLTVYRLLGLRPSHAPRPEYPGDPDTERPVRSA